MTLGKDETYTASSIFRCYCGKASECKMLDQLRVDKLKLPKIGKYDFWKISR